MEYAIIYADDSSDLVKNVNEMIANGWEPQGGPIVVLDSVVDPDGYVKENWHQAMIRRRKGA